MYPQATRDATKELGELRTRLGSDSRLKSVPEKELQALFDVALASAALTGSAGASAGGASGAAGAAAAESKAQS